jgi:iron complex transport system substrate-binding protein
MRVLHIVITVLALAASATSATTESTESSLTTESARSTGALDPARTMSGSAAKARPRTPPQAPWTVRDDLGRTVALPARVGRIVSIQPEISRMIISLGAGDRLVGIEYALRTQDHLFGIIYPAGARLPLVSMSENGVNVEEIFRLKPDLIFASPFERQIVESLQRKTSIPVLALASMGRFDRQAEILGLLGRILGREARAAELTAYFDARIGHVREALRDIPESAKPRVFLSFWGVLTKTPIHYDPVDAAGGINVAEKSAPDVPGEINTLVSVERLIAWNPDLILVHGNYPPQDRKVTVESVRSDPRLASVKAVRNGKVRYTFGFWNWWDMAEVAIETLYLARLLHPDKFPGFDLVREGNEVFRAFYGIEGGFSTLCGILRCGEWADVPAKEGIVPAELRHD